MAIVGNYIVVRMKNRLQVMLKSDVNADKYQNINFYSRGNNTGFDTNNGFFPHQMATDSIYDRSKNKFLQNIKSVIGYTFRGAQKMQVSGNRLWITDVTTREVVGVDILRNEIEEYD